MTDIPLIIFAKVPIVGKVKTRLTPDLTMEQALEVAKLLLVETLELTTKHWPGKVILALWPDEKNEFIQQQLQNFQVPFLNQVPGDLGDKMFAAMESQTYPCAVMGCDVPHLSVEVLKKAYLLLEQGKNLIGPTDDGGYYLLGLQQSNGQLFSNQAWGKEKVLENSIEIAKNQGINFNFLQQLFDIDTYADLKKASKILKKLEIFVT